SLRAAEIFCSHGMTTWRRYCAYFALAPPVKNEAAMRATTSACRNAITWSVVSAPSWHLAATSSSSSSSAPRNIRHLLLVSPTGLVLVAVRRVRLAGLDARNGGGAGSSAAGVEGSALSAAQLEAWSDRESVV